MTKTHKTYGGMIAAAENLIADLDTLPITHQSDFNTYDRRVKAMLGELNALWSNPAQGDEAAAIKNRLLDAWDRATH